MITKETMTTRGYLRTLTILTYALMLGQVFFSIVVFILFYLGRETVEVLPPAILYGICGLLLMGGIGIGTVIYRKKIEKIRQLKTLESQFREYRAAIILRYAMLEMPGFFSIALYLVTGNIGLLAFSFVSVCAMVVIRPTLQGIIKDLQPDFKTQQLLEDSDAVLYEYWQRPMED
jgi:4-hydroxybenzoate polyprenyltransferase